MSDHPTTRPQDEDDDLLAAPCPDIVRAVTGLEPERNGHALLDRGLGIRSTQRFTVCDVEGGLAAFTWPAELKPQALYLYSHDRAARLIQAARRYGWEIEMRPQLAYWLSATRDRLYTTPSISLEEYVARWCQDRDEIGAHPLDDFEQRLWPWMLQRGYASAADEARVPTFLARLRRLNRGVHLRPGLRLLRIWELDEMRSLEQAGRAAEEIRASTNRLLAAVDDTLIPAPHT